MYSTIKPSGFRSRPDSVPADVSRSSRSSSADDAIEKCSSVEDSDESTDEAVFRLLYVAGPGMPPERVKAVADTAGNSKNLEFKQIGDGVKGIFDELSELALDKKPTAALVELHAIKINGQHYSNLDDDSQTETAEIIGALRRAGVATITFFSCYAGAAAENITSEHLDDNGGQPVRCLFMGASDDETLQTNNRDDIRNLVDYYCSCAKKGELPQTLKEHLFLAHCSPQSLKFVHASDPASKNFEPTVVGFPAATRNLADPDLAAKRIKGAVILGNKQLERKSLLKEERDFRISLSGNPAAMKAKATLPERTLIQQAFEGNTELVRELMADGVGPGWNGLSEMTPMQVAASRGNEDCLRLLISEANPGDIDELARDSVPALVRAIDAGSQSCTELLLQNRANPDHCDPYLSPLNRAVGAEQAGIVKTLLMHRADPNMADPRGVLPAQVAVSTGNKALVLQLLKSGARPEKKGWGGRDAMSERIGGKPAKKVMFNYALKKKNFGIALTILSTKAVSPPRRRAPAVANESRNDAD